MLKFALLAAAVAAVSGFAAGWRVHDWRDASASAGQAAKVVSIVQRQGAVSQALAVHDQAAQDRIHTITRTIVERVPAYVGSETDRRFPLPVGFVLVHDLAASGAVSAAAAGAFGPDDAASDIPASAAAAVIAENYGGCSADRQRLVDLQAWAKGEGLAN